MLCKLKQLTFLCMPLQAPAECAPFLLAGGSPAPPEAALTGPSLHTSSSTHGSVVAPNPIRQQSDDQSEPMLMHNATSAVAFNIIDLAWRQVQ